MKKKILAILLSQCMLFSLVGSVAVYAEDLPVSEPAVQAEQTQTGDELIQQTATLAEKPSETTLPSPAGAEVTQPTEAPTEQPAQAAAQPSDTPAQSTAEPEQTPAGEATAAPSAAPIPSAAATADPAVTAEPTVSPSPSASAVPTSAPQQTATPETAKGQQPEQTTDESAASTITPEFTSVGPMGALMQGIKTLLKSARSLARSAMQATCNKPENTKGNGLELRKSSVRAAGTPDANPVYQVSLGAQAASNIVLTSVPCDIVLVLDRSGSMGEESPTKISRLITAAQNFVSTVAAKSPQSRIALVSYSDSASIDSGNGTVSGAFLPVTINGVVNATLNEVIGKLSAKGGTYSNAGLANAAAIFQAISTEDTNYGNIRSVVLFTDGVPGSGYWDDEYYSHAAENTAQDSIQWSKILKGTKGTTVTIDKAQGFYGYKGNDVFSNCTGCGAVVYTIGLFADPRTNMQNTQGNPNGDGGFQQGDDIKVNEYMYRVSSMRPDGSDVGGGFAYTNANTRNQANGYYLTANQSSGLENIFQKIAEQTGTSVNNASVRDYLAPYFEVCDDSGNAKKAGDTVTDAAGRTGAVGQDGTGTYIEWQNVALSPETTSGAGDAKSFATSFYVKPKDAFLGGNTVNTNLSNSGVYAAGTELCAFPQPTVDVPLRLKANGKDTGIYLSQSADLGTLFGLGGAFDGINNRFVSLTFAEKDEANLTVKTGQVGAGTNAAPVLGQNVKPTKCKKYTLNCTLTPQNAGAYQALEVKATANVHVFAPQLTCNDIWLDAGTSANLTANCVNIAWKDLTDPANTVLPAGDAPEVEPMYDVLDANSTDALTPEEDTDEHINSVKLSGTAYGAASRDGKAPCRVYPAASGDDHAFTLHINRYDLTLRKSLGGGEKKPSQSFLFRAVTGGTTLQMSLRPEEFSNGTAAITIKGLKCGRAVKISEDTAWSWRYACTGGMQTVTGGTHAISKTAPAISSAACTFTNTLQNTQWLSGSASAKNRWCTCKDGYELVQLPIAGEEEQTQ